MDLQRMRFDMLSVGSDVALEQVGMQAEDDLLPRLVVHQRRNRGEGAGPLQDTLRAAFGQFNTRRTIKNTQ